MGTNDTTGRHRLPVRGYSDDVVRLHEERMGRNEKRLEAVAEKVDACKTTTDNAINALRREFVMQLTELRESMERRPRELIIYIIVGALLVLGGDTVRAIAGKFLP